MCVDCAAPSNLIPQPPDLNGYDGPLVPVGYTVFRQSEPMRSEFAPGAAFQEFGVNLINCARGIKTHHVPPPSVCDRMNPFSKAPPPPPPPTTLCDAVWGAEPTEVKPLSWCETNNPWCAPQPVVQSDPKSICGLPYPPCTPVGCLPKRPPPPPKSRGILDIFPCLEPIQPPPPQPTVLETMLPCVFPPPLPY
eukprot:Selendium_serpulae@DN2756_c0_g1_i2.p1